MFPALWIAGVTLAWLDPIGSDIWDWSRDTWALMIVVPLAFGLGGMIGKRFVASRAVARKPPMALPLDARRRAALLTVLVACVVIGYLELAHQFAAAGSVPLLAENIDAARASQPGGPTVVLTDLLTVAIIAALSLPRSLTTRESVPEVAIASVAALGFVLAGGRGTVALPLVTTVFARALLHRPPRPRTVGVAAAVVLVLLGTLFFVRTAQHRENPFEGRLYSEILPDLPLPARAYVPLHYGYASNFDVLAAVHDYFPAAEPYGRGQFSTAGFDLFVPGARPLGSVTAGLTGPFVTSTIAGPFFADGGLPLVVLGLAAVGAATGAAYGTAHLTRSPSASLVAGHIGTMAVFGVYTNLFTDHPDWAIVLPALAAVGWLAGGGAARSRDLPIPAAGARDYVSRYAPALLAQLATPFRKVLRTPRIPSSPSWLTRRPLLPWILPLALIIVIAVILEVARDPEAPPPRKASTLQVADRFTLPAGVFAKGAIFAIDGDLESDNSPLWSLRRARGRLGIRKVLFETARPQVERVSFGIPLSSPRARLDVTRWPSGDAVAEMVLRRNGVRVRVLSLEAGRVESVGFARLPAPTVKRDVAIATWSKSTPDLFIIDRGGPRERIRVTVWSGESGFRTRIGDFRAPARGLDPDDWTLDVARLTGRRPDLLAFSRKGTTAKHPEVHVLTGDGRFGKFVLQSGIQSPPLSATPQGVAGGTTVGRSSVFLVRRGRRDRGSLITVPLTTVDRPNPS